MDKLSNVMIGTPSKRQAEVLDFIKKYRNKKGLLPSMSEIAGSLGVTVPTIHQHVVALRKKNLLVQPESGRRRSVQTYDSRNFGSVNIPLLGIIAAGGPIEAIRDPRLIDVPQSMLSKGFNHYALRVAGDSMIEDGIFDGDVVILRDQQTVDDGDKAVAYLPDSNEVTLKRIYREKNRIKLVPANKKLKPFYETNVEVQGKVVGVLRTEN